MKPKIPGKNGQSNVIQVYRTVPYRTIRTNDTKKRVEFELVIL